MPNGGCKRRRIGRFITYCAAFAHETHDNYITISLILGEKKWLILCHDKKVNYCLLNEEGRKIFVEAFEQRMETVFMHSRLKRKVSYRTAIKLDCYKLIKFILEDEKFVPFSLKENI